MEAPVWQVSEELASCGIAVFLGQAAGSLQSPESLGPGALLEQKELAGNRLRFRKLSGAGPVNGWVDITRDGCELLRRLEVHQVIAALRQISGPEAQGSSIADRDVRGSYNTMALLRRRARPSTLQQWYNQEEDGRQPTRGSNGATLIKWADDALAWHATEEAWKEHIQQGSVQKWNLPEMDAICGVEVQTLGEENDSRQVNHAYPALDPGSGCVMCLGCVRPPGHDGRCTDAVGSELEPTPRPPRLGVYTGIAKNVTCPGDDVTYEAVLNDGRTCSLKCTPQLSLFAGGQPPWHCEGTWVFEKGIIEVVITRPDLRGPKEDATLQLSVAMTGRSVIFKETECLWQRPPSLPSDLNISGWWTLTPAANGDKVYICFIHEPGSQTFGGHQKDFEQIRDGTIRGNSIEWTVGDFRVRGTIEYPGLRLIGVEVSNGNIAFNELYVGSREAGVRGQCAVCLQDLEPGDSLRTLECRHEFHLACVDMWLNRSDNCPICRRHVSAAGRAGPG